VTGVQQDACNQWQQLQHDKEQQCAKTAASVITRMPQKELQQGYAAVAFFVTAQGSHL
jgi:hypothetical protein